VACKYQYNGEWYTEEELQKIFNPSTSSLDPAKNVLTPEKFKELEDFQMFENVETMCSSGICNWTASHSTEKLQEVGLNPYPNNSGISLSVTVKSPLGNFDITHYVSAVALGNGIYIYDMPQNEFLSDEFYGKGADVIVKQSYKPRLIPLTIDEIKANYSLNNIEAAKFIRSIINRGSANGGKIPSFKKYINDNINGGERYINELEEDITSQGLMVDAWEERKLIKTDPELEYQNAETIKELLQNKKLTKEEERKLNNLLETKLKLKTREFIPKTKMSFTLSQLLKNVIGSNSFEYNIEDGLDKVLLQLKEFLNNDWFPTSIWNKLVKDKSELQALDSGLEKSFSQRRMMMGFLKKAKVVGFDKALNEYDSRQKYDIRSLLPNDVRTKYKTESQMIFMLNKKFSDINEYLPYGKDSEGKIIEKKDRLFNLFQSKFRAASKVEKYKTLLNYLSVSDLNTDYLYQVIENEAKRQSKYFSAKGDESFQIGTTESSKASPKTIEKVKEFLSRLGIEVKTLDTERYGGINGVAKLLENVIEIAQGKEDVAITEEASHFITEIVKLQNNKLYKAMLNKIGSYNLYAETLRVYGQNKKYQNEDGSPNIIKIKEEAIGKVLAEYYIKSEEGITEKPELLKQTNGWWEQIKSFFLGLIGKAGFNPFEETIKQVQSKEFVEPKLEKGYTRLYRAEGGKSDGQIADWVRIQPEWIESQKARGRWFYKTYEEAKSHLKDFEENGKIVFVDIPSVNVETFNARTNKFAGGYGRDGKEYFISPELASKRKDLATYEKLNAAKTIVDRIDLAQMKGIFGPIFQEYKDKGEYDPIIQFLKEQLSDPLSYVQTVDSVLAGDFKLANEMCLFGSFHY